MQLPSLSTPEGTFQYLMALLLATALFFGIIFAGVYFGYLPG